MWKIMYCVICVEDKNQGEKTCNTFVNYARIRCTKHERFCYNIIRKIKNIVLTEF